MSATVAWAAGFIDGEASFDFTTKAGRLCAPRLRVNNCSREVLEILQGMFGGGISRHSKPKKPQHRQAWSWSLNGRPQVERALEQLLPHLIVRRPRAEQLLDLCRNPEKWRGLKRAELELV